MGSQLSWEPKRITANQPLYTGKSIKNFGNKVRIGREMVSSKWQKQNSAWFNIGYSILFVSIVVMGFPAILLGLEGTAAVAATIIGLLAGFGLAYYLVKRKTNTMVRVIKLNTQNIERDIRLLLKEHNIQFNRKQEEEAYHYHILTHDLKLTLQPYDLLNLNVTHRKNVMVPASKLTLGELDADNESYALKLADLIDGLAIELVDNMKIA